MSALVLYASIEGQTRKIATHIAARLEEKGLGVILADIREPGFAIPGQQDVVILCAPIHMGNYPEAMVSFVNDWKEAISAVPNVFVSVTLAIHSENEDEKAEARAYPVKLTENTGFKPQRVLNVAGALKFLEYDFFKRFVMRRISAGENGPVDVSKDYEFTDWEAVNAMVDELASEVTSN